MDYMYVLYELYVLYMYCICDYIYTCQGLEALGYKEHIDYDLVESTNPAWGKAIVRVNVFRQHRQVSPPFGWWSGAISLGI